MAETHSPVWSFVHQQDQSEVTEEEFWDAFVKWVTVSPYKQIHKIEFRSVTVDGQPSPELCDESFAHIEILKHKANGVNSIAVHRHLFPKDYLRKSEMDDIVYIFPQSGRIEYHPVFPENTEGKQFPPHYYPHVRMYRYQWKALESAIVIPLPIVARRIKPNKKRDINEIVPPTEKIIVSSLLCEAVMLDDTPAEKLKSIALHNFDTLERWSRSFRAGGYKKRVYHDVLVPLDRFTKNYRRMKETYGYWVADWDESTDPSKFVFEDIGIASFLVSLWELEMETAKTTKKPSFVDLGAGNGFLVYLLVMEGYSGYGVDISKRDIWSKYPSQVSLKEEAILPESSIYEVDYIIANHSDELTPWIPLIASRSKTVDTHFFMLPCCSWDFDKKFQPKVKSLQGSKFEAYVDYLKTISEESAYVVEVEYLRIPSTRNIGIIGRKRSLDMSNPDNVAAVEAKQSQLLEASGYKSFIPRFREQATHNKKKRIKCADKRPAVATFSTQSVVAEPQQPTPTDEPKIGPQD